MGVDGRTTRRRLVTVGMCVFNARPFIREAVESILGQTHSACELLIVDDGSTDRSVEALADFDDDRVRVFRQENSGKPVALNQALAVAAGEYFLIQDADDVSEPQRVARLVEVMEQERDLAAVFSGYRLILNGRVLAPRCRAKTREECYEDVRAFRMPSHDPTAMYRMSAIRGMQFAEDLPIVEGHDFILRVGEQLPMCVVEECLYSYRIHEESVTKRSPARRFELVRVMLQRACQRRGVDFSDMFPNERFDDSRRSADNNLIGHFVESVSDSRHAGRFGEAVRTGFVCASLHPTDVGYLKPLLYSFLPLRLARAVRYFGRAARECRRRNHLEARRAADPVEQV